MLVCSISAAPSFIWGISDFDRYAMSTGVFCFVFAYTVATGTEQFGRLRRLPFVQQTLYIGYTARLALSAAFPVAMLVEVFPGILSVEFVTLLGIDPHFFAGTGYTNRVTEYTVLNQAEQ